MKRYKFLILFGLVVSALAACATNNGNGESTSSTSDSSSKTSETSSSGTSSSGTSSGGDPSRLTLMDNVPKPGDKVFIVSQANQNSTSGFALSTTVVNTYYLASTYVTISKKQITSDSFYYSIWTVGGSTNALTFKVGSSYLYGYMSGTHYNIGLTNSESQAGVKWRVSKNSSNTGFDMLSSENVYLQYYSSKENYTGYSRSATDYVINFYSQSSGGNGGNGGNNNGDLQELYRRRDELRSLISQCQSLYQSAVTLYSQYYNLYISAKQTYNSITVGKVQIWREGIGWVYVDNQDDLARKEAALDQMNYYYELYRQYEYEKGYYHSLIAQYQTELDSVLEQIRNLENK